LVSFYNTTFWSGAKTLYKIIPIALLKSWSKHFPNIFQTMKNNKEVYMLLRNLQQQVGEWVEVYYEHFKKLINYLQVKVTNVFLRTIFRAHLQPYRRLVITSMAIDIIIKYTQVVVIYEDNGPVISNYSTLITQLESKLVAQPIITYINTK
jgi:hypothetical protein